MYLAIEQGPAASTMKPINKRTLPIQEMGTWPVENYDKSSEKSKRRLRITKQRKAERLDDAYRECRNEIEREYGGGQISEPRHIMCERDHC
jgi:hypothetical protein